VEERALKRKKNGFFEQAKTEATILHLKIREIDHNLDRILGLPEKPVQSYWNLSKEKREYQRKLRKKGF